MAMVAMVDIEEAEEEDRAADCTAGKVRNNQMKFHE